MQTLDYIDVGRQLSGLKLPLPLSRFCVKVCAGPHRNQVGKLALKPHQKIINKVTREVLRPAGFSQKGTSRFWYLDCGWFACLADFIPHKYDQGTYLTTGVTWFWYPRDYWSYSVSNRVGDFVRYSDDDSFQTEVTALSNTAVAYGAEKQASLKSPSDAYMELENREETKDRIWHALELGVLAGLTGNTDLAKSQFDTVLVDEVRFNWQNERKEAAERFKAKLCDEESFRLFVEAKIKEARDLLKLPTDQKSYLP